MTSKSPMFWIALAAGTIGVASAASAQCERQITNQSQDMWTFGCADAPEASQVCPTTSKTVRQALFVQFDMSSSDVKWVSGAGNRAMYRIAPGAVVQITYSTDYKTAPGGADLNAAGERQQLGMLLRSEGGTPYERRFEVSGECHLDHAMDGSTGRVTLNNPANGDIMLSD